VARAQVVPVDRKLRLHAERLEQLVGPLVRPPLRHRLLHPAEDDPRAFALERQSDRPRARLEPDLAELERPGEHKRGPQHGMTRKGQLVRRREDPDSRVPVRLRRVDEDRLAVRHLERERLQLLLRELPRVGEDGELVSRERRVGEHVRDDVAEGRHLADSRSRTPPCAASRDVA
jgi:hypothetical protein